MDIGPVTGLVSASEGHAPRILSLKGDRAFQRLRRGRPGGARLVSLRWLANNDRQVRVGIVVSKKVGKAVVRNRVRRRLREALKALLSEAELQPGAKRKGAASFDLIVIARPEAATAGYAELKGALTKALTKGRLLA